MDFSEKIEILAEILDVEPADLTPETALADLEEWDSVAVLSFIAMMDEEFGKEMRGSDIRKFNTVRDAIDAMRS